MLGTRARSLALALLLLLGTMTVTPAVGAVGPNQSDMGMTSGDLPDNLSTPNQHSKPHLQRLHIGFWRIGLGHGRL